MNPLILSLILASVGADSADAVRAALANLGSPIAADVAFADRVFLVVTVNPEGRVKVGRGPFTPDLIRGRTAHAVVRVINQSGGRQRLTAHARYEGGPSPFTVEVATAGGLTPDLSGGPVDDRMLAIRCETAGRHELTVGFDAGQGTQDLGFRGEVPVLLNVRERRTNIP